MQMMHFLGCEKKKEPTYTHNTRTINYSNLFSNFVYPVSWPFGQRNMHITLDFCSRPASKETNVPIHKKSQEITVLIYTAHTLAQYIKFLPWITALRTIKNAPRIHFIFVYLRLFSQKFYVRYSAATTTQCKNIENSISKLIYNIIIFYSKKMQYVFYGRNNLSFAVHSKYKK